MTVGTLRPRWLIWIAATVMVAAYVIAGLISSSPGTIPITLTQGSTAKATVLRVGADTLRTSLRFHGDHQQRPELGEWAITGDPHETGLLRFDKPGAQVRISASTEGHKAVLFEAMPKNAYGQHDAQRTLTADLSLEPGVWRWPPTDEPRLPLSPGMTKLRFEVAAVDPHLRGESVDLTILPPLSFKSCQLYYCWLWWWWLWPLFAVLLACWAAALLLIGRQFRGRKANG